MIYLLAPVLLLAVFAAWYLYERGQRPTGRVTGGYHPEITLPHEEEFELYHNALSHCARKVRLVMAERGIPNKPHPIDLIECGSYENISRSYLRVNPSGLVPTLVHNGHPIYESDDILAYVAAQRGDNTLVPDDEARRSEMNRWIKRATLSSNDPMGGMDQSAGACVPALTLLLFAVAIQGVPVVNILEGVLFHPDKKRPFFFLAAKLAGPERLLLRPQITDMVQGARNAMRKHLEALNQQISESGGEWLLGSEFTLADISWAAVLLRLEETGWLDLYLEDPALHPLADYFARLTARPSWAAAITSQTHPHIDAASARLRGLMRQEGPIREAVRGG